MINIKATLGELHDLAQKAEEAMKRGYDVYIAMSTKPLYVKEIIPRSIEQNDMKEMQVKYIAEQVHGGDEDAARREAKYLCGIPILCRDDPEFMAFCEMALAHLVHEERIEAMAYVPVTSIMSKKQMKEYIDKVFDKYAPQVDWGDLG